MNPHAPDDLSERADGSPAVRVDGIDRYVGSRLRQRRAMMGLTQKQLARLCGITYQQVHKYETGVNRISAGRLYELSLLLGAGVAWFYDGVAHLLNEEDQSPSRRMMLQFMQSVLVIEYEHLQALNKLARALSGEKSS